MKRKFIAIVICLIGLISIAESQDQAVELKTLENTSSTINFPADWETDESGLMGTKYIIFVPDETLDNFRENINLVVQPVGPEITELGPIIEATQSQLKNMITDFEPIKREQKDGYYLLEYKGKQGVYSLHWNQHLYLKDQNLYVLTFTSSIEDFEVIRAASDEVMGTFTFQ